MAHSELEKPLFVSSDGIDADRCHDATAPCRTIGYALGMVGKGGEVRVASGRYEIDNVEDLFHLVSGVVEVRGGMDAASGFESRTDEVSVLVGVPVEYRSVLGERGFHVVADRKRMGRAAVTETEKLLAVHGKLQTSMKAAPCSGGTVNNLPCDKVDLLSHVAFSDVSARPAAAADVWGFVDLNTHREYAIVGYNNGTAVFDVTDAENPLEVGFVDGQIATWRDIKVHQYFDTGENRWAAYAYVTTDGAGDGMFVIDMTGLPHSIRRISYSSDFLAAHNVYASNTDFATGLSLTGAAPTLIIAGSSIGGGRYRAYTLADPAQPAFSVMPNVSSNDYMHDAASMIITDSRKDTQCVNATAYCEVLFDFNESTVDLWDITDTSNPVRLSRTPYNNASYVHSGWVSEDKRFLFVQDELDEQRLGLSTTLRAFSISNLAAPQATGNWEGPTTAIDHNGFVRGNRYYMSNYSRGLTILDISDPQNAVPVGRLDTYPFSDSASFVGAWGAYPFFPSGNVAISDIDSGFYMAADRTLDVPEGTLSFAANSFAAVEGQTSTIVVNRSGGAIGAVSVDWELIPATADESDLQSVSQTPFAGGSLSWADGDSASKSISLDFLADGQAEGMELVLLKLYAPTGGATLSSPSIAGVYASDPSAATEISFDRDEIAIGERGFGTAIVVLNRAGSASGSVSVDYSLGNSDATGGVDYNGDTSGTVTWADGDADPKSIEFDITDDGSGEADEFFDLVLGGATGGSIGTNASIRVTIRDGSGFNQAPNAVAGSSQSVAPGSEVTLDGSRSNDPDGDTLAHAWTQTMGPAVTLSGSDTASARFTAPEVTSDTLLRFELTVTDPDGFDDTSTASVTVSNNPGGSGGNGLGSGGGALTWLLLGLVGFAAGRRSHNGRIQNAS
jgi:choice-of-anchor B domain-containing protein